MTCRTLEEGEIMRRGERLVIIGQGGAGGPAAMLAKRLMREVDVTVIREEKRFIVR
jgi:D-arabinose 1-dehydrogenase-like Zn-dependent alcohol dehydrogenase